MLLSECAPWVSEAQCVLLSVSSQNDGPRVLHSLSSPVPVPPEPAGGSCSHGGEVRPPLTHCHSHTVTQPSSSHPHFALFSVSDVNEFPESSQQHCWLDSAVLRRRLVELEGGGDPGDTCPLRWTQVRSWSRSLLDRLQCLLVDRRLDTQIASAVWRAELRLCLGGG